VEGGKLGEVSFDNARPFFKEAVEFIDTALATGSSVLVHCARGVSRSATIVLAFLIAKKRLCLRDAFRFLMLQRPVIGPNAGFVEQLAEWEEELLGRTTLKPGSIHARMIEHSVGLRALSVLSEPFDSTVLCLMDHMSATGYTVSEKGRGKGKSPPMPKQLPKSGAKMTARVPQKWPTVQTEEKRASPEEQKRVELKALLSASHVEQYLHPQIVKRERQMQAFSLIDLTSLEESCKFEGNVAFVWQDEGQGQLFLGNRNVALDVEKLKYLGIRHIVNCAPSAVGCLSDMATDPTTSSFTHEHRVFCTSIHYLCCDLNDHPKPVEGGKLGEVSFDNARPFFKEAVEFIDTALATGSSVLVHCARGVSRSATIVLAFLIAKKRLCLRDAFRFLMLQRPVIGPNAGFVEQLAEWEEELLGRTTLKPGSMHARSFLFVEAAEEANCSNAATVDRSE